MQGCGGCSRGLPPVRMGSAQTVPNPVPNFRDFGIGSLRYFSAMQ